MADTLDSYNIVQLGASQKVDSSRKISSWFWDTRQMRPLAGVVLASRPCWTTPTVVSTVPHYPPHGVLALWVRVLPYMVSSWVSGPALLDYSSSGSLLASCGR